MPRALRILASAAVGGLLLLGTSARVGAQAISADDQAVGRLASFAPGSIGGVVLDERGRPVSGALVSSLGPTNAFAITDRFGRFELSTLSPGPYVVRVRVAGFAGAKPQVVDVRPSTRTASSIALRRVAQTQTPQVLAAGVGQLAQGDSSATDPADAPDGAQSGEANAPVDDDHGETAWRVRHLRRGVLKDAVIPDALLVDEDPTSGRLTPVALLGRAAESSARFASSFFASTPFSGQVNLLTAGSFDVPQDLLSNGGFSHNIANVKLSAPVGAAADWTVQGAFTQGDLASWVAAGSYKTRAPARHAYDVGLSYATERYSGANPLVVRDLVDGSRNAGDVYAFDTFAVNPALSVTYGARFAHYDYLAGRNLVSPRAEIGLAPASHMRFNAVWSSRAVAPGAEEFLPPTDTGVWLPPQRTFSSLDRNQPLEAERVTHVAAEAERDFGRSTVTFEVFRQQIDNQLVTLFGVDLPDQPKSTLGHYAVGEAGDGSAVGYSASLRTTLSEWVKGSLSYSVARASLTPAADMPYLVFLAPSSLRPESDVIHNVSTSVEANVPETSTRVIVLCRVSNAFARPATGGPGNRPGFDTRFDVQVRQSLPFMDFTSAKWEMLVDVRNFFREASLDQSVYDELLVVHPPKRIVGGLAMRF